ncbi:MAG: aldolase [Rhodospirillales bacterium]|nr:aldolase [Rhodospirillales bacterium]
MRRFRDCVRGGSVLLGTFIKTASHQIPEIIGAAGLDFAIIDAEHAPFDLPTLDRMVMAGRGASLPCLVRVPELTPASIGQVLDLGAAGVVVPHIASTEAATRALGATKYAGGRRGFSPSTRAGGYGTIDPVTYRQTADHESSVWCQIEDEAALSHLNAIAAIDQLDCMFLGRADLALSLGVDSQRDPKVVAAVAATAEAGRRHGRTVGIFIGDTGEIPDLLGLGITVFVCGSDQSFMLAESRRIRKDLSAALDDAKSNAGSV